MPGRNRTQRQRPPERRKNRRGGAARNTPTQVQIAKPTQTAATESERTTPVRGVQTTTEGRKREKVKRRQAGRALTRDVDRGDPARALMPIHRY